MGGIVKAYQEKEVQFLNSEDLGANKADIGLNGSMTEVWKIFIPQRKGEHLILDGTIEEMVSELVNNLKDDKVL